MIATKDLTSGNILKQIILLAIPIIGSSFIQMAYNMVDIFWIGKTGSFNVTAVGSAGYILWFSVALIFMIKVGVEVGISQSIGKKEENKIINFAQDGLKLTIMGSVILMLFCIFLGKEILNMFKFDNPDILKTSYNYLRIFAFGFPFLMTSFVFSGIYMGLGDSKTPFWVNSAGFIMNLILDPILIFGWGIFPKMNAEGAALASAISQFSTFVIFIILLNKKKRSIFSGIFTLSFNEKETVRFILKTGFPVSLQITLFAFFAYFVAQTVSKWGAEPVAMISIGANIEAVSWMTASGFATALSTFTGQNFGAKKYQRIVEAFILTTIISVSLGAFSAIAFYFYPGEIVSIFNNEQKIVEIGIRYMKIVSFSQIFMCIEICSAGVFNGIGRTKPPSIIGISMNATRALSVFLLAEFTVVGLDGAWISISVSSIFKGVILLIWLLFVLRNLSGERISFRGNLPKFTQFIPTRIRQQIFDKRTN